MRKIFPLVFLALLATGPATAQTRSRTPQARASQAPELGSRERELLLHASTQRSGGIERARALQVGNGAPADLGSVARRNALRGVTVAGSRLHASAGSMESLGAVERTTLLRRGPVLLQQQLERRVTNPSGRMSGAVLAHRMRRR